MEYYFTSAQYIIDQSKPMQRLVGTPATSSISESPNIGISVNSSALISNYIDSIRPFLQRIPHPSLTGLLSAQQQGLFQSPSAPYIDPTWNSLASLAALHNEPTPLQFNQHVIDFPTNLSEKLVLSPTSILEFEIILHPVCTNCIGGVCETRIFETGIFKTCE